MLWESSTPWTWAVVSIVIVLLLKGYRARQKQLRLPPGPHGLPLLGNAFDIPTTNLGRGFAKLAQKYGDVVYLNVLGQPMVVLNSLQAAQDLLDKRSANYSDRPDSVMTKLTGLDCLFILMSYGDQWRLHRRAFHQSFNENAVKQFQPVQLKSARKLLAALLHAPHDLKAQANFSFASTLMRVAYGIEVMEKTDEYFRMVEDVAEVGGTITVPGRFPVDIIRSLQYLPSWFPGGRFKKWSARAKTAVDRNLNQLYKTAVDGLDAGTGRYSLVSRLLEDANEYDLESVGEHDIGTFVKNLAITTYAAGSDTSHAALQAFFLAMAMFPKAQKKAQEELDRVIGGARLPEFEDQDSLPYVNALFREVLRWHPITPISVPHRTVADDVYNGYFIPAKTIITVNVWSLARDPARYPNPETFLPERFLDANGKCNLRGGDPTDFAFGFGRRVCPGRYFAESSFFILAASILHVFSVLPPLDERGNPMKLTHSLNADGVVAYPEFYDYIVKPRSSNAEELILEACNEDSAATS